ncbi:MAG: sugar phosphate isomerase/epimerase [Clostridia bacterium]|nr:sugar phosphate isomerase/epimerase [Clostridia bacterium]
MKVAACSAIYKDFSLEQALDGIADSGYRFVEVAAMPGWCEHISPYQPETASALQCALTRTGLTLVAISAHCDFLEAEPRRKLMDTIALAQDLGCGLVITSPGAGGDERRDDRILALGELDACCARHRVGLALEPHGEYGSGALLCKLIEEAGTRHVSVNYDTANVIFFRGLDPLVDIRAAAERLSHVHFKDKRGPKGVWDFPPLGQGELDFGKIMNCLRVSGYDGCISVEIEFTPDAKHTCAELNAAVKSSLDHLNVLIDGRGLG